MSHFALTIWRLGTDEIHMHTISWAPTHKDIGDFVRRLLLPLIPVTYVIACTPHSASGKTRFYTCTFRNDTLTVRKVGLPKAFSIKALQKENDD